MSNDKRDSRAPTVEEAGEETEIEEMDSMKPDEASDAEIEEQEALELDEVDEELDQQA